MPYVAGVVYDDTGAPVGGRTVRVYRRDTGAFLAETSSASSSVDGDASYASVSLLLHADGSNGATSIIDSSSGAKTATLYGNTQISTAQSKFGGASLLLDGSGDYIKYDASSDFDFGSGDFTWECWLRRSAVTEASYADAIWCAAANPVGFAVAINPTGHIGISADSTGGADWDIAIGADPGNTYGTAALALNTWYHVAVCRSGSNWYGFVDGVLDRSFTSSASISASPSGYFIGHWHDGNARYFNGYIDDLRITKGVARYTTDFTPPTAAFADSASALPVGGYKLPTAYTGEVNVVTLDAAGGTNYNDLILRTTPV